MKKPTQTQRHDRLTTLSASDLAHVRGGNCGCGCSCCPAPLFDGNINITGSEKEKEAASLGPNG